MKAKLIFMENKLYLHRRSSINCYLLFYISYFDNEKNERVTSRQGNLK